VIPAYTAEMVAAYAWLMERHQETAPGGEFQVWLAADGILERRATRSQGDAMARFKNVHGFTNAG
jgi:hypothetical protein